MKKVFIDFLLRRDTFEKRLSVKPVITISRECGCPSKLVAEKLTQVLQEQNSNAQYGVEWRWIDKEIIAESAKKLKLDPVYVERVAKSEAGGLMDILSSFSPLPVSDVKIRSTMADIIRGIADEGRVIIVGRGGVTLLQNHPNSIHIRLQAPFEWRIERVMERYGESFQEAKKRVKNIDKQRMFMRDYFEGKKSDRSIFDLVFNCKTLTPDEIVAMIVSLLNERKLI